MSYGFVYILANESMPGLYKIGCTERSPALRAKELSKVTACPSEFDVVCYGEYSDFQMVERDMHAHFSDRRVNDGREFFKGPLADLMHRLEMEYIERESFCEVIYAATVYYDRKEA